jgi:phytoene dehydrogenase-like protein
MSGLRGEFDAIVIGAGAAGLAAGRRLMEAGAAVPVHLDTVVEHIDHGAALLTIATGRGTLRTRTAIVTAPTNVLAGEAPRLSRATS